MTRNHIFSLTIKYFQSNKKGLNQKSRRTSKNGFFFAFFDFLAIFGEKSPPNVFHPKSARKWKFSKSSFSELRRGFPFKLFLLDQWTCEVVENTFFGPAEGFSGIGGGFLHSINFFDFFGPGTRSFSSYI